MSTSLDRDLVITDLRKTTWVWPQADDTKVINLEPFGTTGWYWGGSGHGKAVLKCGQQPWIRYEDVVVVNGDKDPDFWDGTGTPMKGQVVCLSRFDPAEHFTICGYSQNGSRVALESTATNSVLWQESLNMRPHLSEKQSGKADEILKALADYKGFLDTDDTGGELARHLAATLFPLEES